MICAGHKLREFTVQIDLLQREQKFTCHTGNTFWPAAVLSGMECLCGFVISFWPCTLWILHLLHLATANPSSSLGVVSPALPSAINHEILLVGHINNRKTVAGLIYARRRFFQYPHAKMLTLPLLPFIVGLFLSPACVRFGWNLYVILRE